MRRQHEEMVGGPSDIAARKAAARTTALVRRDAASPEERAGWSAAIRNTASTLIPAGAAVSAFLPIRSEVDLRPLVDSLAESNHPVGLPVIVEDRLLFRAYDGAAKLIPRGFGTFGPPDDAPVVEPDVMLVPLAAFDRLLNRIGYGKAYYDTTIARILADGRNPRLIGVAFALQEVDHVPVEPHDMALNLIVTEREVILPTGT